MALNWGDEYATGCGQVDQQHRAIFDAMNSLEDLLAKRALESATVMDLLARIVDDTKEHFACEEQCMSRRKCSAARDNETAHAGFLETIAAFQERLREEGPTEPMLREFHSTAQSWLHAHICQVDVRLRECAKN